jgi:peptidoglycan/LPS O-acetylase OafA/YrhL
MSSFAILQARLNGKTIPALDGVRAIAVFLVICYHFGFAQVPGGHGVMMFFVLSGFLITWLLLKENERNGNISLKGFYTRRVLRIFPAFYVYWLLVVGLLLSTSRQVPWAHAWSAFFYVSNYYGALHHHPENSFSHTWSLAIEEQFYLLWPVLFILWRRSLARMTVGLVALIGAVWIYRAVLCLVFNVDQSYIYSAFDTRLDHLMVGCLLAVLIKREALKSFWNRACAHAALPLLTIALLLASIFLGGAYVYRYRDVFGFAFEPVLIAVLIAQFVSLSVTPWWRWLNARALRFLGRISYPLYLYQQMTLYPARRVLAAYPVLVQLGAAICLTIGVAAISYYVVERPFLKLKDRRTKARERKLNEADVAGQTESLAVSH